MATIHFTTTDKFKEKLSKLAANNNLTFESEDVKRLEQRLTEAYNEIEGALLVRGLSVMQISTWKRGEEFQLDIATYWYAKDCAWGGKAFEEKDWTKVFDRRMELTKVPIVSNDGVVLSKATGAFAEGLNLLDVNASLGIFP
jgi:hypothetical protein